MSAEVAPPLSDGRYRLVGVLGEGGMSTVYSAFDQRLGVHRAVKVLSPALSHHASIRKRFDAEARTTARLVHTNIVNVHDVGLDNGRAFIVLELMTGGSLMGRLEALGPLPPRMASEVLQALLAALQYAHERGVIHRDVKPHNLLVDGDGVPKLTDFGIARLLTSDHGLTRTGAAIGTPAYMAPEQRGNASQVDARADVFGAGASLYTLLTGKEPFDIYAVELQSRLFAGIPEPLAEIIQKATRYEPSGRYPSANAMIADLKRVHDTLPENPEDTPPLGTPLPGKRLMPTQPTAAPESDSQHTFFTPPPDAPPPPVGLAAFPSLSGVELSQLPGESVERSLNGEEPLQPPAPWYVSLGSRTFVSLILGAVLMAVLMVLLLNFIRHRADPPGPPQVSAPATSTTTGSAAGSATTGANAASPAPTTPAAGTAATPGAGTPSAGTPGASGADNTGATPPTNGGSKPSAGSTSRASTPSGSTRPSSSGTSSGSNPGTSSASAPTTTTPSTPRGKGQISISSKPRADVFLDDVYAGRTRLSTTLEAGTYSLVLEDDEGLRWVGQITVAAGAETRICRDLKTNAECER